MSTFPRESLTSLTVDRDFQFWRKPSTVHQWQVIDLKKTDGGRLVEQLGERLLGVEAFRNRISKTATAIHAEEQFPRFNSFSGHCPVDRRSVGGVLKQAAKL